MQVQKPCCQMELRRVRLEEPRMHADLWLLQTEKRQMRTNLSRMQMEEWRIRLEERQRDGFHRP